MVPFCKCASLKISRVFDIVVVNRFFPLGEKNALLMERLFLCVATGLTLDPDFNDANLRTSHRFVSQSKPQVARIFPFG